LAEQASSMCFTMRRTLRRMAGCPKNPRIPWVVRLWKGPAKWIGNLAILGGIIGVTLHYLRFGPKRVEGDREQKGGQP
jgi:hypothetical protein